MRVLHVIPAVAARYGGPGVVAVETVRALRAAGVDALLLTTDADGNERLQVETGRETLWDGVPAVILPLGGEDRYKWSGALARWLDAHVSDFDVVDVHAVFSHSSVAAGRACRQQGIPYVVRPHGALDPWSLSRKAWQKRLLFWWGVRPLLTGASYLQYTTAAEQACAERALSWLPPGRIVPLGVDSACFMASAVDPQRPYVLALSRLEEKKRLDVLIGAFHEAAGGADERWRLVIAGDGRSDYVEQLRGLATSGPGAARISFAGWVSGDEKRRLVAGASVFASPSAQENFGLSLVEAMAAGVPVLVTSGVNLSGDVAAAGAGWVVGDSRAALASALRAAFADDERRRTRGEAARRLAQQFSWPQSAGRLIELYAEMAARRPVVRHA